MKSTAIIVAVTLLLTTSIDLIQAQSYVSHRPTHIIKLKSTMNTTSAHDFILSNHRAYALSQTELKSFLRKKRRSNIPLDPSMEGYDTLFSAAGLEQKLFLDSITVDASFTAVSGIFPDDKFVDYLQQQYNVEYVETNQLYKAQMLRPLQEYQSINNTKRHTYLQRMNKFKLDIKKRGLLKNAVSPNWGQARITQRERGDMETYTFDEDAGEGVHVYVLDTGVNTDHLDFEGRASTDANFVDHEDDSDLGGHGTHVAGKIAGNLYGISKKVQIHSVKILDKYGDGSTAQVIKGIMHVINVAVAGKSLINLSLSGPKSRLIDEILSKASQDYNIPIFVSAGNSASDGCFFSPSSNPNVFAVGASDLNDDVATYSNVGECVRIYAPGSEVESTWIGSSTASKILDGTSMANPHVIGIAAALLSKRSFNTVEELYNQVIKIGTSNTLSFKWSKVTSPNNNRLAYLEN